MNQQEINKIRVALIDALEKVTENEDFLDLTNGMFWGKNTVAQMAEAALIVLVACSESQKEMEENS